MIDPSGVNVHGGLAAGQSRSVPFPLITVGGELRPRLAVFADFREPKRPCRMTATALPTLARGPGASDIETSTRC